MHLHNPIKIKRVHPDAKLPAYATPDAAGADLYALAETTIEIPAGKTVTVHTGISMAIPEGCVGLLFARSGLAIKQDLAPANKVGVIDSDYRGEILVALHNHGEHTRIIENHDRVAQLAIIPYVTADLVETDSLDDTVRGSNRFGSTGKN